MKITRTIITATIAIVSMGITSWSQDYYDDDIYFNPSKDKDKNIEQAKKAAKERKEANALILYPVADYPAADTYTDETSSKRDIDEYNRRGIFATAKSTPADSTMTDDFENTRKIEKYYNPTIIIGSNDQALTDLYYAEPANVNIYVNAPGYWGWGYPYYSGYWGWGNPYWSGWYDPWFWGPSWSWGWGPSWSWSWSWNWAWGPSWSWGPGWGPGWGGPAWSWGGGSHPYYYNPRHPGAVRQPSYVSNGNVMRPGYNGGNVSNTTNWRRPNTATPTNTGTYRPATGNSTNNQQNNSYVRPGRNNNTPTYRQSTPSTGGSRGGFSTGGSNRTTGGSTGRGRH